jgi:hypothetical protein
MTQKRGFQEGLNVAKSAEDIIGVVVNVIVILVCALGSWRLYTSGAYQTGPIYLAVLAQIALVLLARASLTAGIISWRRHKMHKETVLISSETK